jgi:hypothetical protein
MKILACMSESGFTISTLGDPPERPFTADNKTKQLPSFGKDCGGKLNKKYFEK